MDIKKLQLILLTKGIRVAEDDPLFTMVALNEAVLEDMSKKYQDALVELVRKSVDDISSAEIGQVAKRLAVDVAARERNKFFWLAMSAMTISALVFGGAGYALRMGTDAVNMSTARARVVEANERANADIAAAEKSASDEIEMMRKSVGWVGTEEGRLAKRFFDSGGGLVAAQCNSPAWEVFDARDGKWCIPKKRDLFGGDKNKYGWLIP